MTKALPRPLHGRCRPEAAMGAPPRNNALRSPLSSSCPHKTAMGPPAINDRGCDKTAARQLPP